MSAIEPVVERLKARRSGSQWIARCPAHDDRSPSMWVKEGDDGRVLLGCRAGCKTEDILAAAEMGWPDLFEQQDFVPRRQSFVPRWVNRSSESSSRQITRQEIEEERRSIILDQYLRWLESWRLEAASPPPKSRVSIEFDDQGEVTRYDLTTRYEPIGDLS